MGKIKLKLTTIPRVFRTRRVSLLSQLAYSQSSASWRVSLCVIFLCSISSRVVGFQNFAKTLQTRVTLYLLPAGGRFEKVDELGQAFDDAWKAVASEDAEAGRLAAAAEARPEETSRKPLQVGPRKSRNYVETTRTHDPKKHGLPTTPFFKVW